MNRIVVGVDIAKRVFQLHWVEPQTGEIVALQLKREKFLEHFANRSSCLIGMEACGGSQHWARSLQKLGHEVKLLSGRMVKPFVVGNKNDAADARGISMRGEVANKMLRNGHRRFPGRKVTHSLQKDTPEIRELFDHFLAPLRWGHPILPAMQEDNWHRQSSGALDLGFKFETSGIKS